MTISYNGLFNVMKKNRITKTKLREYGLTPSTVAKFAKGEYVSMKTIVTLCEILKCQPGDIIEVVEQGSDRS